MWSKWQIVSVAAASGRFFGGCEVAGFVIASFIHKTGVL
jgi:hypothetical protein